jgi:multidrug resistance efflux pump
MDELETKQELNRRSPDTVARREVERLQNVVDGRRGALDAAKAAREGALAKLTTLLPSQKALAEAAREQAQVELGKMVVYAGVSGRVEQFALRVGDIVNPFMRPAGVLIPTEAGRGKLQAGFGQIEAQVMEVGMFAEVSCLSKPFEVFPMVVTGIQDFIATGQFRAGEQLVDVNQLKAPGSILVFMEPLYEGTIQDIPPGSSCIANAYTNNHDKLQSEDLGQVQRLYLHMVDAVALVHAMILRVQVLLLPVKMLVFSGH